MPNRNLTIERVGAEMSVATAVVIAVHGRAQSPSYMLENLVEPLDDSSISWLLPAAQDQSWYPGGFMDSLASNQPSLDNALEFMLEIEHEVSVIDPSRVIWLGFSQGACLVAEHLARRPRRWGGLAVLTGGRIGPPGFDIEIKGSFDAMATYFGVGAKDDWVPVERVSESVKAFERAGAKVIFEVFAGSEHEIRDAEIERVRALISGSNG